MEQLESELGMVWA